jgi:hypothetical protein
MFDNWLKEKVRLNSTHGFTDEFASVQARIMAISDHTPL